jgi:hypothetical protein
MPAPFTLLNFWASVSLPQLDYPFPTLCEQGRWGGGTLYLVSHLQDAVIEVFGLLKRYTKRRRIGGQPEASSPSWRKLPSWHANTAPQTWLRLHHMMQS